MHEVPLRVGPLSLVVSTAHEPLAAAARSLLARYRQPLWRPARLTTRVQVGFARPDVSVAPPLQATRFRPEADGALTFHHHHHWTARLDGVLRGAPAVDLGVVDWCRSFPHHLGGALRTVSATLLPRVDALMLHGAALHRRRGGQAIAFVGASESGKSSMQERLPGWCSLADDTIVVARLPERQGWSVMGSPFTGCEGFPTDGRAMRLEQIVFLSPRSPELCVEPLPIDEVYRGLLSQLMWYAAVLPLTALATDLLLDLAASVPGRRLSSSLRHDIAPCFRACAA